MAGLAFSSVGEVFSALVTAGVASAVAGV